MSKFVTLWNRSGRTLVFVAAIITGTSTPVSGGTTLIYFDDIPDFGIPVDSFGASFPGVTFSSQGQWIASYVNATDFVNINNRCLANYGTAPLSMLFASASQDLSMDIGSGYRYQTQTANVSGYLGGQLVFSQNFVTQPTPSGAEEIHARLFGIVDRVVLNSTSGGFAVMLDNLSFTPIPEPRLIHLLAVVGVLILFGRRRRCWSVDDRLRKWTDT